MSENSENLAYCHSCGLTMNVSAVAPFSNVACPSCGKHTRVKREFGPYSLVRRHAVGGMSMVFVAHDATLHREVALKILSEEYSADSRRVRAFEDEARITASFSHPHVVRVLTTGQAFGRLYIAMEFVPGGHFEHQIRERGTIPEIEMLLLAIDVAEGLQAAHAAGLIHRDIKPGNILLDAEGHAKIVDFGLALVTQGGKAKAQEIWATPYYVPPETIEGFVEDFRSDIYAFGATLYHALAGVPSCGEESMSSNLLREAKRKVIPLGVAMPDLSEDTCRIVDRAMAYDPANRFDSYDEMIAMLKASLKRLRSEGAAPAVSSGNAAKRRAQKKRAETLAFSLAGLLVLIAVTSGIWWVVRDAKKAETAIPVRQKNPISSAGEAAPLGAEVIKNYREAHTAIQSRDYERAWSELTKLRDDSVVQEPTRSWAAIEAVAAAYLQGSPMLARQSAVAATAHANSVPEDSRVEQSVLQVIEQVDDYPPVVADGIRSGPSALGNVMSYLIGGLKNWEQGMLKEADECFSRISSSNITSNEAWFSIYREVAAEYRADYRVLSDNVFLALPDTPAGCQDAISRIDELRKTLKTKGRANYNLRAWQLDLARHAKILARDAAQIQSQSDVPDAELRKVLLQLQRYVMNGEFENASQLLRGADSNLSKAQLDSLGTMADAASTFLTDLEADLSISPAVGVYSMKSGSELNLIQMNALGQINVREKSGGMRVVTLTEVSVDSLVELHRNYMKLPLPEVTKMRRHWSAIAFDWLAGDRKRAVSAAQMLSQSNKDFAMKWAQISAGLPID